MASVSVSTRRSSPSTDGTAMLNASARTLVVRARALPVVCRPGNSRDQVGLERHALKTLRRSGEEQATLLRGRSALISGMDHPSLRAVRRTGQADGQEIKKPAPHCWTARVPRCRGRCPAPPVGKTQKGPRDWRDYHNPARGRSCWPLARSVGRQPKGRGCWCSSSRSPAGAMTHREAEEGHAAAGGVRFCPYAGRRRCMVPVPF